MSDNLVIAVVAGLLTAALGGAVKFMWTRLNDPPKEVGQRFRLGEFDFTIEGYECGFKTLGQSRFEKKRAQGQFCLVVFSVRNHSNEAASVGNDWTLLLPDGRRFAKDFDATQGLFDTIFPGSEHTGEVVFDIPRDGHPDRLLITDHLAGVSGTTITVQL